MAQTVSPSGACWPFAIVEIFAEQAEFPELVGDVFSDVGDRAIGADDDFVLDIFLASAWLPVFSLTPFSAALFSSSFQGMIQQPAIFPALTN